MDTNTLLIMVYVAWIFYAIGHNAGESAAKRRAYIEKNHPDMYDNF